MASDRYDEALIQILQAEGKIMPFLDVIFGFLQRRTDFYHEHTQPSPLGFPPGVAEQLVVTTFRKWREIQHRAAGEVAPPVAAEEEVITSSETVTSSTGDGHATSSGDKLAPVNTTSSESHIATSPPDDKTSNTSPSPRFARRAAPAAGDTHNGAARETYSWSQTICDLTVHVPVPAEVRRARQVIVELRPERVAVRLAGGAELLAGRLHRPVRAEESTWSLLPAEGVQLSLEKATEGWWRALLDGETEIDLTKIEAVKPWEDLSEEEQMKVGELRAREEAKRRPAAAADLVATGGRDAAALLREAWDAEGSPFKGRPYDPEAVQIIPNAAAGPDCTGTGGRET